MTLPPYKPIPQCTVSVNLDKVRECLSAVRKWKVKRPLGGAGKWEYEVGEDLSPKRPDSEGLTESIANVSLCYQSFTTLSNSHSCQLL